MGCFFFLGKILINFKLRCASCLVAAGLAIWGEKLFASPIFSAKSRGLAEAYPPVLAAAQTLGDLARCFADKGARFGDDLRAHPP